MIRLEDRYPAHPPKSTSAAKVLGQYTSKIDTRTAPLSKEEYVMLVGEEEELEVIEASGSHFHGPLIDWM
jgi:hypothetical protein